MLMQTDFEAAMRQKQALEDDATTTKRKMEGANALLSALAGEEGRWTEQSKAFDDQVQRLTGAYAPEVFLHMRGLHAGGAWFIYQASGCNVK